MSIHKHHFQIIKYIPGKNSLKIILVLIFVFLSIKCEKRIWDNPYDPDSDKSRWAPTTLVVKTLSASLCKLTWTDNAYNEAGFKIDRKIGNRDWKSEYGIVDENVEEWIDTAAVIDTMNYYRVYAYLANNNSRSIVDSIFHKYGRLYVPDKYANIQSAIDKADDGDSIIVSPGVYYENINFKGKNIVMGSRFLITSDTAYISQTAINGNQNGSVVTFKNGEDSTALLTGFTITNGFSDTFPGGIYCDNSSPRLENLMVIENIGGDGGGIGFGFNSNSRIKNVTIQDNDAILKGGGIICGVNSNISLQNVEIKYNSAPEGGGIWIFISNPKLNNVKIIGNKAFYWGGGIYCIDHSSPSLVNVTVTENTAIDSTGGGIYCISSNPNLINSILWNNSPNEIYFFKGPGSSSITVSYSDIQGGEAGIETSDKDFVYWLNDNIDTNPLFVNAEQGDVHLRLSSPCIDAGNPDPQYNDADGSRNDMGAYGGPNGDW